MHPISHQIDPRVVNSMSIALLSGHLIVVAFNHPRDGQVAPFEAGIRVKMRLRRV